MGKVYVGNSFSVNMIKNKAKIIVEKLDWGKWAGELQHLISNGTYPKSCIGHEATAKLYSRLLGNFDYPGSEKPNRIQVSLEPGDVLYVLLPRMRLEEGKVLNDEEIAKLLNNDQIVFYKVEVQEF
ncbi:MAG: hypothetical protein DRP02_12420 [Candidatus Gerdarchaeota archaeon]|nr:MAG: hypothetical protein DRP02_12420 [Candidatus Gerdarchaeota archaeon]